MASHFIRSLLLISLSSLLLIKPTEAGCGITTYWGTDAKEGSLQDACNKTYPYYKHIALAFLKAAGETPELDLGRHCDASLGKCKKLAKEIEFCQSKGVKVLLSVDDSFSKYDADVAEQVAQYVYSDFLSGAAGPLGKVALDGVDFYISKPGGSMDFWVKLAETLAKYTTSEKKLHLSAVVAQCVPPEGDNNVYGNTIATGLLDYVWVQFYNNPTCDIRAGVSGLLASWNKWSSYLEKTSPGTELFMGVPASPNAASPGSYIYPCVLTPHILPEIKKASNFGGLMVWNRYYDVSNSYSPEIVTPLCGLQAHEDQILLPQVV